MRKWLLIGAMSAALMSAAAYWYFTTKAAESNSQPNSAYVNRGLPNDKKDGDAETSEAIEPLIVEGGAPHVQGSEPADGGADHGPMPRVVLRPGMKQPPRPDAALGRGRRMPYADEEEILRVNLDPITRILESELPELGIFEEIDKQSRQESEHERTNPMPHEPKTIRR